MSSYFDKINREVRDLAISEQDPEKFLLGLMKLEENLIHTLELLTGDIEVHQQNDLVNDINRVITQNRTRYKGGDHLGDEFGECEATQFNLASRSCLLSRELHSLFHEIARRGYEFRFGCLMDNPEAAVKARDRWAEEHWQSAPYPSIQHPRKQGSAK